MRKIIAVGILLLFIVLLLPQLKNVDSKPEKENNIKNINDAEEVNEIRNIVLPGFVELDVNKPGKLLCNLNEDFYLQFNIILRDTDEVIYSSGLVEYGNYIDKLKLNREIEKGEYDAIVFIQPYDIKLNKTNNAKFDIRLII